MYANYSRERLVEIASDKFGTHVLCKAVAIKELEVSDMQTLLARNAEMASARNPFRRLCFSTESSGRSRREQGGYGGR
jgi:hypothetical protein